MQPAQALHHAVVGIVAAGVQKGFHALADALELRHAGVEDAERMPDQCRGLCAENFAHALVAGDDGAVARDHHTDGCMFKSQPVIDLGHRGSPLRNTTYTSR
ncbi:hypothetical protein D3C72_1961000 [compost metagenome]